MPMHSCCYELTVILKNGDIFPLKVDFSNLLFT